jgi:4-carboxymuconolactone decarboxylase
MDKNLYDRGLAKRRQVLGDKYVDAALHNVNDFNREFQRLVNEYCWGEVWGDETGARADGSSAHRKSL